MRTYSYIGPAELLALAESVSTRQMVSGPTDVSAWIEATHQSTEQSEIVVTFIVDLDAKLWIADRRSEHVACAAGRSVLSAGEMTFSIRGEEVEVCAVTNQSTGYCPAPDSWPAVTTALSKAELPHPTGFTTAFVFRRCDECGTTNIVKEDWFYCGVCDAPLDASWNLGAS